MSEKDWAKFYREHKDDPEIWGEPEEDTPPPRSGGLSATITVRFSPDEATELRELAEEMGATYSEIVRLAVRKFVQFRLSAGKSKLVESDEGHDLSLSNATTSTASLAIAHG
jgi:hypothetical protein